MAPKGKRPTPPTQESSQTDASSGEESRTKSVPPRAVEQRKEDEEVDGSEGSESRSDDEAAEQEPTKPSQPNKSFSDSDSGSESSPEDGTHAVESVAATKEGRPMKKPARCRKQPGKRARNAEGEEESYRASKSESRNGATNHETPKPSPDLDSSSEPNPQDETPAVVAAQHLKKRPTKRARNGGDTNDKVGAAAQRIGEGSGRFQRLWSEKDEIKLLHGMIEFRKKKGLEPSANVRVFKDFLEKNSVKFDFRANESQFYNKMRKMKAKFTKGSQDRRIWKKPHDQEVSKLCRILWDGENGGEEVPLSLKKSKISESAGKMAAAPSKSPEELEVTGCTGVSSLLQLPSMGLDEEVLRIGMRMMDSSDMDELKERWRQLRLSELQVANDRATLMNHQAKLFMDCYRRAKAAGIEAKIDR